MKDPVCGMELKNPKLKSEYNGKEYAFCSEACRQKFARDPRRYAK